MKLEWKETERNTMSWDEAKSLEVDGWRLPTRVELLYAYDNNIEGFEPNDYWSSSSHIMGTNGVWVVIFSYGGMYYNTKTSSNCVRLCREVS